MKKNRFLVRRLKQVNPKSACVCIESYHFSIKDAFNEFDIALFNARSRFYVSLEICEIGDDDNYYPFKSVLLNWL